MATEAECRAAIQTLLERVSQVDREVRRGNVPDRSIGCTLLDLDLTYVADLRDGELHDLRVEPGEYRPQVRVLCTSDQLVALTDGELSFAHAWATGQIHLDASLRDLLRLRSLG
jgi:hypothetical protein